MRKGIIIGIGILGISLISNWLFESPITYFSSMILGFLFGFITTNIAIYWFWNWREDVT